jgi:hypothetical protein
MAVPCRADRPEQGTAQASTADRGGRGGPRAGVHHLRAIRAHHDRVEVQLDDLGKVLGQRAHPEHQVAQRRDVRLGPPPVTVTP